jgi:hypothetical protein
VYHQHRRAAALVKIVVFEPVKIEVLAGERVFGFQFVVEAQIDAPVCCRRVTSAVAATSDLR